jgi:hypothetical protein
MPSSRPKVTLDEQSFQDMLAAAFTIQEHNAQRMRSLQPPARVCGQCGAPVNDDAALCGRCAEEPRPGEELQRKWASLWLMSQEQSLQPESLTSAPHQGHQGTVTAELPAHRFPEAIEIQIPAEEIADPAELEADPEWPNSALAVLRDGVPLPELTVDVGPSLLETVDEAPPSPVSLRDLHLKLRFHRADFYLVVAIAVSTFAMVWVLSATPAPGAHRKPRLRPWERALVSLGLAEAPEPPPRRGNPNISVWVDPKTALYYCAGEELYGKVPGGHVATQREAQLDQFEPAGRAACE